jgi:hypothetical protein
MLRQAFDVDVPERKENASVQREGPGADFGQCIEDAWLAPFVAREDLALYERFETAGLLGFWRAGGTVGEYRERLSSG